MAWRRRVLATGLRFPEGPVYLGAGRLVLTEIQGQCVTRFADGRCTPLARTGGGANGAALGGGGDVYVANNGGLSTGPHGYWHAPDPIPGRIQRISVAGAVSDWCTALPGPPPHRPNDLCFGPDGALYFTDPHNWEDLANLGPGRLCRADATGRVELLAEIPFFPNGIAFAADHRILYVAQSVTQRILAFPWTPSGVGTPRELCALPRGYPDGFCVAADGDLYVCGSLGDVLCVFDAEGRLKETVEMAEGSEPTNCCFGDGTLYVTLAGTGELVGFDLGLEGLPLFPMRTVSPGTGR
jgi:gluconolactonase